MDEEKYNVHFELISLAGTARSLAMEAIEEARNGNTEEAKRLTAESRETHVKAHKKMFGMLEDEANGRPVEMNIIAVHAQDHLMTAISEKNLIERIVELRKVVNSLLASRSIEEVKEI